MEPMENGYTNSADYLRHLVEEYDGRLSPAKIDKLKCRADAMEFVGRVNAAFIEELYDTGIFQAAIMGNCLVAMDEAGIAEDEVVRVAGLLDKVTRNTSYEQAIKYMGDFLAVPS